MVTTENQYAIETVSLTKIFPDWWGRARVVAVEDLNLQIHPNEIYGFLGPNGSGKTTTIKMLLNLLHPTKGAAFVLGGVVGDPAISARNPGLLWAHFWVAERNSKKSCGNAVGDGGVVRHGQSPDRDLFQGDGPPHRIGTGADQ